MKKIPLLSQVVLFLLLSFVSKAQINADLLASIQVNDIQKVDSLIESGIPLDEIDENGANALMWACHSSSGEMVQMLFERGATPPPGGGWLYFEVGGWESVISGWYGDLISIAAVWGDVDLLDYLVNQKGYDINSQVEHPEHDSLSLWTPLMHAANAQNAAAVNWLLENGAKNQLKNKSGLNAMEICPEPILQKLITEKDFAALRVYDTIQSNYKKYLNSYFAGDYPAGIALGNENLLLIENNFGKDNYLYAIPCSHLAIFYFENGESDRALYFTEEALRTCKKSVGEYHVTTANAYMSLAVHYTRDGRYEEALPLYFKALDIIKQTSGVTHPFYATSLLQIGILYFYLGDYQKSKEQLDLGLSLQEQHYGKDAWDISHMLIQLGGTNTRLKNYELAESNFLRAQELIVKDKGKDHYLYGVACGSLAMLYMDLEKLDDAQRLYTEAVAIIKKTLGENSLFYSSYVSGLSNVYEEKGDLEQALALATEARERSKQNLGSMHDIHLRSLMRIGHITLASGAKSKAEQYYMEAVDEYNSNLISSFPFLPENIQLKWKILLDIAGAQFNSLFLNRDLPSSVFQMNTQMKGSTIIANSSRKTAELEYEKWRTLKRKIGVEYAKGVSKRDSALIDWEEEAFVMESKLTSVKKDKQNTLVTSEILRGKLEEDALIIDFVHFDYYNANDKTDSLVYVAYLVTSDKKTIESVPLFEVKKLEKILGPGETKSKLNELYATTTRGVKPKKKSSAIKDLSFIWEPLLPHLKNYNKIYISPTGLLNKINLSAIAIDDSTSISDRFEIVQYNNLKAMLQEDRNYSNQEYLLVGGVQYDYKVHNDLGSVEKKPTEKEELVALRNETNEQWDYLPGTAKEVEAIGNVLAKKQYKYKLLSKEVATETALKTALSKEQSPRVLHLSTHGFFFPDVKAKKGQVAFKSSDNPMIRSGLILAGANYAWKNGEKAPNMEDDGILTSYEVANLNLENTELVVLSACETGLGDIQGSEGVFGLQRAFKIAGAKYIMMSLWQVPDKETSEFMISFYINWLDKKMDIRMAFQKTQKEMQAKYKNPYLWAGFVLVE